MPRSKQLQLRSSAIINQAHQAQPVGVHKPPRKVRMYIRSTLGWAASVHRKWAGPSALQVSIQHGSNHLSCFQSQINLLERI